MVGMGDVTAKALWKLRLNL